MSSQDHPPVEKPRSRVPRLTLSYLETLIERELYHHFSGTGVTVCCLVVANRYTITEHAVCANPQQFDLTKGQAQARRKAINALMEREQYLLRQRLYESGRTHEEYYNGPDSGESGNG